MATGVELGSAFIEIRGDLDHLKKDLDGAKGSIGSMLGGLGKTAALGVAGIGVALAGVGAAALALGGEFDGAFDALRTGTGATGAALEGLKADFKAVVSSVPTDFGTASEVVSELAKRTGATGESLQGLSKAVIQLSTLTGTDAVTNVGLATRAFGDWSIATADQEATLDKLFRASQASGIGVDELMGKVVQFGAPLRAMGFSLDESAAMLAKWEKEGVNTELVLGSMRIAMGKFADAGIPAREGLDATIKKIQELGPSADATSMAMDVFGARAGPDMAAAILEGRFELGELLDTISSGSETVLGAADDTQDFAEKWTMFMNRAKVAVEPLATAAFDLANKLMDWALPALESVMGFMNETAGPVAERVGGIIKQVFDGDIEGAMTAAGGHLGSFATTLVDTLREWGEKFVEWIAPLIPPMLRELGKVYVGMWQWIGDQAPGFVEKLLGEWVPAFIGWAAQAAIKIIPELVKFQLQVGQWILTEAAPAILTTAVKLGEAVVRGLLQGLANLGGQVGTAITQMAGSAIDAAKMRLGIASPSKEFEEIGELVVAGFVVGVDGAAPDALTAVRNAIGGALAEAKSGVADIQQVLANAGAVPQRRNHLTPDEAMKGDVLPNPDALDEWGRTAGGEIKSWADYWFKVNQERAHRDDPSWLPSFAAGVENFRGGLAMVHQGELLTNLPAGTDVIPAADWLQPLRLALTGLGEEDDGGLVEFTASSADVTATIWAPALPTVQIRF